MKTKILMLCVLTTSSVWAGTITITNPNVVLSAGSSASSPDGPVTSSLVNQTVDGFTVSGTACFDAFCPGQSAPGAGPSYLVNSPLSMRVTSFTATHNVSDQDFISLSGDALFRFSTPDLVGLTVPLTLTIDGTAPSTVVTEFGIVVSTCDDEGLNCSQVVQSGQAKVAANSFGGHIDAGNITLGARTHVELDFAFKPVQPGETVVMPDSLVLTFGTPNVVVGTTPEPGTLLSLCGGLLVLGGFRLRYSGR